MTRVAVLDDYQKRAHEFADWASLGSDVEVEYFSEPIPRESLAERLGGFDVLVLMRERTAFPKEVLEQLPSLKLLITTGMRNAAVDAAYLAERGVTYCGTGNGAPPKNPGIPPTAELAWALIFAAVKRITLEDRALREGRWQDGLPISVRDLTLGLAGLGNLGASMVGPARAFGMDVIAWSQNLTAERAQEIGVELVTKEELLSRSDVLSIHLVLSSRTRGLFGAADLAQMKPSAVLVNTSRGPIVDEEALVSALRSGAIAAAGIDVYEVEPLPSGSPLTSLPNTVLTPHFGYANEKAFRAMYNDAVEDIRAFLAGEPVRVLDR